MLIGTMNPEEGELRPQFLDRFGLSLSVSGVTPPLQRRQIVDRRIEFDGDPLPFISRYEEDEKLLSSQVAAARSALHRVAVPGDMVEMAVALANAVAAQGHRAEIAIIKAARSLAACIERAEVGPEQVIEAARFVLPHRITNLPFASTSQIEEKLEEVFKTVLDEEPAAAMTDNGAGGEDDWDDIVEAVPGATAASNVGSLFTFLAEKKKSSMNRTH
jgi:Mg-chelatase subunit ChlI